MRDSVEASELMPGGFDLKKMSYLGLVIEAPESALSNTSITVFEQISDQLKKESGGAAIYAGLYRTDDERPTLVRLMAATQAPAVSTESKPISAGRAPSAWRRMRTVASVMTPSWPSEPQTRPMRS